MIPSEFIQQLLQRVDIVDVVERYVPLKKSGSGYVARCPFHSEKTPSFSVSPERQIYHCFGCGVSGSAISFLMEYSGMSFPDAVRDLAQEVGLSVPAIQSQQRTDQTHDKSLMAVLAEAHEYYRNQLKNSPIAIDYLKKRGISGVTAARYQLGYAPGGWRNLAHQFAQYDDVRLVQAGLVIEGEENKRYDRFRERIMFPIFNQKGGLIGFGGRVLGAGEPKYLNSPETPLFEKGRELYGLTQARQAIREQGRVLVVEGYMDVVGLSEYGVMGVVATLGTAVTPFHLEKLLRLSDEVVFAFDGDSAGRQAAKRTMDLLLPIIKDEKKISFLFFPDGEDPDSFVRSQGRELFEAKLSQAKPFSQFLLDVLEEGCDLQTMEGRAKLLSRSEKTLAKLSASNLRLQLQQELVQKAKLPSTLLEKNLKTVIPPSNKRSANRRRMSIASLEINLIQLLFDHTNLVRSHMSLRMVDPNALEQFIDDLLRAAKNHPLRLGDWLERCRGGELEGIMEQVSQRTHLIPSTSEDAHTEMELEQGLIRLEQQSNKRYFQELFENFGTNLRTHRQASELMRIYQSLMSPSKGLSEEDWGILLAFKSECLANHSLS